MLELLSNLFGAVGAVASVINTEAIMSASKQLQQANLDLIAEKAKGQDADDAKIEALYAQMAVYSDTIKNECAAFAASKNGTPSASPATAST